MGFTSWEPSLQQRFESFVITPEHCWDDEGLLHSAIKLAAKRWSFYQVWLLIPPLPPPSFPPSLCVCHRRAEFFPSCWLLVQGIAALRLPPVKDECTVSLANEGSSFQWNLFWKETVGNVTQSLFGACATMWPPCYLASSELRRVFPVSTGLKQRRYSGRLLPSLIYFCRLGFIVYLLLFALLWTVQMMALLATKFRLLTNKNNPSDLT